MARSMATSFVGAMLLAGGMFFTGTAEAAESYDNCNNYIDTLPATISTQGVWCLRKDVATSITSGNAIRIDTNNVTIDCNGFKVGGLGGGPASKANGIFANNRQNITVRGCNVRGFATGIHINGGAGHMVERNRLDHNLGTGIVLGTLNIGGPPTDNSVIQGNSVYDTGSPTGNSVAAIFAGGADVIDNTVSGVFTKGDGSTYGIVAFKAGAVVRGNRVRELEATSTVQAWGLWAPGSDARVEDNSLAIEGSGSGHIGILGDSPGGAMCVDNTSKGFSVAVQQCFDGGGNAHL